MRVWRKTDDSRLRGGLLMGSTGEADRKRRHFSSISPTATTAKKQPFVPLYAERKGLDAAVLLFQNKKLIQKLETQKVEIRTLEDRLCQLRDKQQSYEKTVAVVNISWKELVDDLESHSSCTRDFVKHGEGFERKIVKDDGDSPPEDAFLSRLLETEATESSSASTTTKQTQEDTQIVGEKTKETKIRLHNMVAAFDDLSDLKNKLFTASLYALPANGQSQKVVSSDLRTEVKNLRIAVLKLHLKNKSLAGELQSHRDTNAKNKAVLKRLKACFRRCEGKAYRRCTAFGEANIGEKVVQQTKATVDFFDFKAGRIEDQLKAYLDHIQRHAEDRAHNAVSGENTQRRLLDVRT
ncbi:hypothetical protein Pfo_005738 [Paulownia fortunei]|nr:hypothetical protein Pfo_005738 [Paulownia fortunei]